MFAVQIHSIKATGNQVKSFDTFLNVYLQNQLPRRYFVGDFASRRIVYFECVVCYAYTTVTLTLDRGWMRHQVLGVSSISRFESEGEDLDGPPKHRSLFFGGGDVNRAFELNYTVVPVVSEYRFALSEVACLRPSSPWRQDRMWAKVEHNHSPHSVKPGLTNWHDLGPFDKGGVRDVRSGLDMVFHSVSNVVVTFCVKGLLSVTVLGAIKFVPFFELYGNQREVGEQEGRGTGKWIKWEESRRNDLRAVKWGVGDTVSAFEGPFEDVAFDALERNATKKKFRTREGAEYSVAFSLMRSSVLDGEYWKRDTNFFDFSGEAGLTLSVEKSKKNDASLGCSATDRKEQLKEESAPRGGRRRKSAGSCSARPLRGPEVFEYTEKNYVEVLIDGEETFRRYYETMMRAKHSINILAWEIHFSFGLVLFDRDLAMRDGLLVNESGQLRNKVWVTLMDVLLTKVKQGVRIRILVWRHEWLSRLSRLGAFGKYVVEKEVTNLEMECRKWNVKLKICRPEYLDSDFSCADLFDTDSEPSLVVVFVGNPKGLISSHHEKLVLIDPECSEHMVAFTGGFDIANRRYDCARHQLGLIGRERRANSWVKKIGKGIRSKEMSSNGALSPLNDDLPWSASDHPSLALPWRLRSRGRTLWHDLQVLVKGEVTRHLYLHFAQRWSHAFSKDVNKTRELAVPPRLTTCRAQKQTEWPSVHANCVAKLGRVWTNVLDGNHLFEDYCRMIKSSRRFLYVEHQYPFQNVYLTQLMCEQLKTNSDLQLIILTAAKTDLPRGLIGDLFDWSQDHIVRHINHIYSVAPNRVGIYSLVTQNPDDPRHLEPIYVHSKLCIIDDQWMIAGSTNMDNLSFFYSSELSVEILDSRISRETRIRLFREHLGHLYTPDLDDDFDACFCTFKDSAQLNLEAIKKRAALTSRLVPLVPLDVYKFVSREIRSVGRLSKLMERLELPSNPALEFLGRRIQDVASLLLSAPKL
ncbi:uncharacterized protein LOC126322621 [Schistocerca gregaria]|uniref:uncharacterized protein LOC126322621 n=1 Tax=Schistocerca gregaria TaxID=7010 RepID=UPI00211DD684|nr:uncharacterized protein LOC126322621 [Schistocerca gregaria]